MADTKNFRVEYGINVTTNEVINSSGKVVANALSAVQTIFQKARLTLILQPLK